MLRHDTIDAFVRTADTSVVADALIGHSLIGTEVGDRVLAASQNYPERHTALRAVLIERNAWEV